MKTLTTLFLLLFAFAASAQDLIIKKTGDTINCKVTELATIEVKYYYPENPKLIFGVDNDLIDRVEFGTGEVVEIGKNSFANQEYYAGQRKMALKLNFLSPLMGSTEFTFEKNIKPGRSWEAGLGIIGAGFDPQELDPFGAYGKFAYKFIKEPDFYLSRMHYAHILKGAYIAPEIALRYMSYDEWGYYWYDDSNSDSERKNKFSMAFMLKFGKQWVFDNTFLVDVYCGVGYGIGGDEEESLNYGFIVAPEEFPIAFTGGIRIGLPIGK